MERINISNENDNEGYTDFVQETKRQVKILIDQYNQYIALEEQLKSINSQINTALGVNSILEIFKNTGKRNQEQEKLKLEKKKIEKELNSISDQMRFQNPAIWMLYKALAYKGSKKEMKTIKDFKDHLENDRICAIRMMYLEHYLNKRFRKSFLNYFGAENLLENSSLSKKMYEIIQDRDFIENWQRFENNTNPETGEVNKWFIKDYPRFKEDTKELEILKIILGLI